MAVAVVNSAFGREAASTTSHSVAFAPGTCDALYIGVYHDDDANNVFSSVQFNGVTMTLVAEIPVGNERLHVWRVLSPAAGTNNFTCTTNNSNRLLYSMVSMSGVNQTTPNGTVVTASAATAVNRATASVTSPTDGLVLGMYRETYSDANPTAAAGTLIGQHRDGNNRAVAASQRADTGIVSFASSNYAFAWDVVGIPINAAAGGATGLRKIIQQLGGG